MVAVSQRVGRRCIYICVCVDICMYVCMYRHVLMYTGWSVDALVVAVSHEDWT